MEEKKKAVLNVPVAQRSCGCTQPVPFHALRARAAYPRAPTPTAEYLALTLCKPTGAMVKYTHYNPPPLPYPADPRHWTPPRPFQTRLRPERRRDWLAAASLGARAPEGRVGG